MGVTTQDYFNFTEWIYPNCTEITLTYSAFGNQSHFWTQNTSTGCYRLFHYIFSPRKTVWHGYRDPFDTISTTWYPCHCGRTNLNCYRIYPNCTERILPSEINHISEHRIPQTGVISFITLFSCRARACCCGMVTETPLTRYRRYGILVTAVEQNLAVLSFFEHLGKNPEVYLSSDVYEMKLDSRRKPFVSFFGGTSRFRKKKILFGRKFREKSRGLSFFGHIWDETGFPKKAAPLLRRNISIPEGKNIHEMDQCVGFPKKAAPFSTKNNTGRLSILMGIVFSIPIDWLIDWSNSRLDYSVLSYGSFSFPFQTTRMAEEKVRFARERRFIKKKNVTLTVMTLSWRFLPTLRGHDPAR